MGPRKQNCLRPTKAIYGFGYIPNSWNNTWLLVGAQQKIVELKNAILFYDCLSVFEVANDSNS